eukprot:10908136-Alexandrium_andersonii.AAC.1
MAAKLLLLEGQTQAQEVLLCRLVALVVVQGLALLVRPLCLASHLQRQLLQIRDVLHGLALGNLKVLPAHRLILLERCERCLPPVQQGQRRLVGLHAARCSVIGAARQAVFVLQGIHTVLAGAAPA